MEIETLISRSPVTLNDRLDIPSQFTFDLSTLIENLKHSYSWAQGELNSIILLKSSEKQILLTALHERTEVTSFQSNDSVTIQICEGKLKFHAREKSVILNAGHSLILYENVNYSLTAVEETVFLLTISKNIFNRQKAE